jgi:pyridoxine 4-dehydrogenase
MKIGIIGAGKIGGTLAGHFVRAGHEIAVSNSRGPETLGGLVAEIGAGVRAVTAEEAARFGEVGVVSIPFGRYRELPTDGFAAKVVIDTNNYYPGRDGHFAELDNDRTTSSELLQVHLSGTRVVKAFNAIHSGSLRNLARPSGKPDRVGIPISSDDEEAKRIVAELIDEVGFDPVDAGTLAEGGASTSREAPCTRRTFQPKNFVPVSLPEHRQEREGYRMSGQIPIDASLAGTIEIGGEFTVNRMGFGAMRITGRGIWGEPRDRNEALRVLRRAVELGVNFIDTAHSYGPEVSERLIAEALHPYPDDLVIATKSGFQRSGPHSWYLDGRPETIRQDCERSLELLRLDRIDLLQLHTVDRAVPIEDSVGALAELQTEGKIRLIGLSNVSVDQLRRAQEVAQVVSVQNRYSLADRGSEKVLDVCEEEGIAFLPWYPLGAGSLTRATRDRSETGRAGTPAQLALAWLLHRSPVMVPIPGTSSVAHLEENVAAAGLRLSDDDFKRLGG